jgi:hypothetical protein
MIAVRRFASRQARAGQILPLTALMMVILIGMTALAIDVSAAYLTERWERSVADAAALSGAQSLQKPGTRALPEAAEQGEARINAMRVLQAELGGTPGGGDCYTSAGCELSGTPYFVSVQTPSPSCVDCDSRRAVQVSIWQPSFGLTFGRIFGESSWTVRSTSVAGMVVAPQYGLVTLRPSELRPNETDANADDLVVTGGSKVIVSNADIATNSNAMCSGFMSGSEIRIEDPSDLGFELHHYGAGAAWVDPPGRCFNPPDGFQVTTLVDDPAYTIPSRTGVPYATQADGEALPADCAAQQALVPDTYRELKTNKLIKDPLQVTVTCLNPGTYATNVKVQDPASGPPNVLLLLPGVYFFDGGLEVSSTVIGGYVPSSPGVALVFPQAGNGDPGQFVTKTSTSLVALNYGSAYCPAAPCPGGTWADPADGPEGPVQTPEPHPTLLTIMVQPNPLCVVEAPPSSDCKKNENQTLQLQGGGSIFLAGVQYAPSDNAVLTGSSGQASDVGAFWAWTLQFNGGTNFNLTSANPQSAGVLRIDPACSPNVSTCNP